MKEINFILSYIKINIAKSFGYCGQPGILQGIYIYVYI